MLDLQKRTKILYFFYWILSWSLMALAFVPIVDWKFFYRTWLAVNLLSGTPNLAVLNYVINFLLPNKSASHFSDSLKHINSTQSPLMPSTVVTSLYSTYFSFQYCFEWHIHTGKTELKKSILSASKSKSLCPAKRACQLLVTIQE